MSLSGLARFARLIQPYRLAATARLVVPLIVLGCTSPHHDRNVQVEAVSEEGIAVQTGKITIPVRAFMDVYYPVPFASPPSLKVSDRWGNCKIIIQAANHFRILSFSDSPLTVEWTARGPKGVPPPPAVMAPPIVTPQPVTPTSMQTLAPVPVTRPSPPSMPSQVPGLPAEPEPITSSSPLPAVR